MSPTAESLLPEESRPRSGQYKHKFDYNLAPTRPTSSKPANTLTRHAIKEAARMRMKMSNEQKLLESESEVRLQFFHKEPCLYKHTTYLNAAKIFSALRHDTLEERENPYLKRKNKDALSHKVQSIPELVFEDDQEKRLAFELAFTALKYQLLFEEVLQDCSFFAIYPEFNEDAGLVMVMLCDFQSRKFQQRTQFPGEILDDVAVQIEDALVETKTHLNASLARHRIKAEAPSLDHLLPDAVRSKEEIRSSLPLYVWVNQKKTNISEVIESLKDENFQLVSCDDNLVGKRFRADILCNDVLVFAPECREDLIESDLIKDGKLVLQDKSSSIPAHSVKYLVGDDSDVIHINVGSGMTTAHLASLMDNSGGHVWAFGPKNTSEVKKIQENMEKLGIKGVKVLSENFLDVEPDDQRFRNVRVILVTAECSKSGITNPVDFIVNEGEDMKILKDLSTGETDLSRIADLAGQHINLLKHALKFAKVQAVVYTTRSIHEAENENVVTKATEYINMVQQRKFPYRVVPPVIPFTSDAIDKKLGIHGKFIKYKPTDKTSGCFVAVVTREPEDAKEAARDVLARAQAKGLLSGKKSREKHAFSTEQHNGEVSDTQLLNGHASMDTNKLLSKRSRKSDRRLPVRAAASAPQPGFLPSYTKQHASSPIHNYIHAPIKPRHQGSSTRANSMPIGARLYNASMKRESDAKKKEKSLHIAEHVKVIKHPAPFRHRKSKKTKSR